LLIPRDRDKKIRRRAALFARGAIPIDESDRATSDREVEGWGGAGGSGEE